MSTFFEKKCEILADIWLDYRMDTLFEEFIQYNDLGLPLAYAICNDLVEPKGRCIGFIEETYVLLLEELGMMDEGFVSLDDLLERYNEKEQ